MGMNDRYDGYYTKCNNITSDIHTDIILNSTTLDNIWFGTDWHLYKWDDDNKKIIKNPHFDEILRKQQEYVKNGIFIFLGDITDDECQNYDELAINLFNKISGSYKIFILGNNDLQPEEYYIEKLGFDAVYYAYQWGKYTFSHLPMKSYYSEYNIHGHMHQYWDYGYQGVNYNNMMKLYTADNNYAPISMSEVLKLWNSGYFIKNVKK